MLVVLILLCSCCRTFFRLGIFLTHLGRMDLPTLISRICILPIVGVFGDIFYSFFFTSFIEHSVSKQWRPRSDAAFGGVMSMSALFCHTKA